MFGGLLVVIGGAFLVREFVPTFDFDIFWPLLLVGLGVVLLVGSLTRGSSTGQELPVVNRSAAPSGHRGHLADRPRRRLPAPARPTGRGARPGPCSWSSSASSASCRTFLRWRPSIAGIWSFTWSVAWVVAGVALLYSTTGQLGPGPGEPISECWPWAAVVLGAWFLIGAALPIGRAVADHLALPLASGADARVRIRFGAGELAGHAAAPGTLLEGSFEGGVRRRSMGPNQVEIEQDTTYGLPWLDHGSHWDVGLAPKCRSTCASIRVPTAPCSICGSYGCAPSSCTPAPVRRACSSRARREPRPSGPNPARRP